MNDKVQGNATAPRRFARKSKKNLSDMGLGETLKHWFGVVRDMSGFLALLGILIVGSGTLTFTAFQNAFGILLLDVGGVIFLFAMFLKVYDVLMKLIGD